MALPLISEYKPQSIPVIIDPTNDNVRKHFRCPSCGNVVFDYYGSIKLITYNNPDDPSDGTEASWASVLGSPYPIMCQGRLSAQTEFGLQKRIACRTTIFKIGL